RLQARPRCAGRRFQRSCVSLAASRRVGRARPRLPPQSYSRGRLLIWQTSGLARRTRRPCAARPERRARKRIGSAKAALPPYSRPALIERRIAAVVDAALGIGRAPAPARVSRLARLRRRPTLCVSVGEQQSHHCDTEKNMTDRAHAVLPVRLYRAASRSEEHTSELQSLTNLVCRLLL